MSEIDYKEKVRLVSADFVRQNVCLNANIESKYVNAAIREAQNMSLNTLIGSQLLTALCKKVYEGDEFDDDEKTLIGYIEYFVAYDAGARLVTKVYGKVSNAGVTVNKDDTYEPADFKYITYIADKYSNTADYYAGRIVDCLKEMKIETGAREKGDMMPSASSSARCGIYLGGARGKRVRG